MGALPTVTRSTDAEGISPTGVRQYQIALGRTASHFRIYPAQAQEAGWEGRVTLRLAMSGGGMLRNLRLHTSSGHPILDQAAEDMLRLAIDNTPVPETLHGKPFDIDLTIDFNLADTAPALSR